MSWPDSTTQAAERLAGCLDHLAQQHLVDAQVCADLSARLQAVTEEPESASQACDLIWKHREILVRPLVQQGQLALSRLRIGAGDNWTALPTTLRSVAGAIESGYAEGWAAMDGQRLWIPDHLLHHAMLDLEVGHLGTWPLFESDPHAQQLFEGLTPPHPFRIWQDRVLTFLNGGERLERAWLHQPGSAWIQPAVAIQRSALEGLPGGGELWAAGSRDASLSATVALPTDRPWWMAGWPEGMPRRTLQWMEHAQGLQHHGSWQAMLCPAPGHAPFATQALLWLADPSRTPAQAVADTIVEMIFDDPGESERNDGDWWLFKLPMPFSDGAPLWLNPQEQPFVQLDTLGELLSERRQVPTWHHLQRGQVCLGSDLLRWGLGHLVLSGSAAVWTEPGNRYVGDWWFSVAQDEPPPASAGGLRCRPVPTELLLKAMTTPSPGEAHGDGFSLTQPGGEA